MWNKFFGLMKLVYDYGEDTKKTRTKSKTSKQKLKDD
jgi:hypothetical protein